MRGPAERSGLKYLLLRSFATVYPAVHAAYELSFVGYLLAYAVGRTPYASPFLHVCGLTLRKAQPPPVRRFACHHHAALQI